MARIKVICPLCGGKKTIDTERLGSIIPCRHCKSRWGVTQEDVSEDKELSPLVCFLLVLLSLAALILCILGCLFLENPGGAGMCASFGLIDLVVIGITISEFVKSLKR